MLHRAEKVCRGRSRFAASRELPPDGGSGALGSLAGQKKYAEAEPLLLSGYDGMNQQHPAASTTSRFTPDQAGEAVVTLYQDWGNRDKVAEWKTNSKRQKPPQTGNVRELA